MFCRICRQHKRPVKRGTSQRVFIEVPSKMYRKDVLDAHIGSDHHTAAFQAHATLVKGHTVTTAFEPVLRVEHEAVVGAFKCLYWLVKHEIAHHTNYPALLELAELLGCDYFAKLKIGKSTNYRSHRMVDEMLEILASVIEAPILEDMRNSQAVGLELDESTDVAVIKQLDVHANTIMTAIHDIIDQKGIPQDKIFGLGTDGAAVMTGRQNGVAKQLCDTMPWLVTVHCAAHRLALVCKDASPYMKTFRDHLQQLHLYFRNSANRTAVLKAAATTLGICDLKVKEVKDTRWLSQHQAVSNLRRNLHAVLTALAEEVEHNKCPVAKGLYSFCATYRFVAALYLQADVLPHLARLSKVFQKEDVNFLAVQNQVPVTIETIHKIKEAGDHQPPGSALSTLHCDLDNPDGLGLLNIQAEEERERRGQRSRNPDEDKPARDVFWERFCTQVMEPYLEHLTDQLNERFHQLHILGAFSVLGPQAARNPDQDVPVSHLKTLAAKFLPMDEERLLEEWPSFKEHLLTGVLKDKTQLAVMRELASQYDELSQLYPCLSKLAAIALTVPVGSVNCERDFSTMNRVPGYNSHNS
ncbi:zinc finger protein 862-like [Diretmus argenteus]